MNPEPIKHDDVFSASEVARRLGISVQAVTKRIKRGTINARKEGSRYAVLGEEVNRLLNPEAQPPNRTPLNPQRGFSEPGTEPVQGVDPAVDSDLERLREQLVAAEHQVEVYRGKLEYAERESDAVRGERGLLQSDVEHLRKTNTQLGDTVQNLTEELKGLTIALHHEQNQRLALESHVKDEDENEKPKKPGLFRRAFSRKPRRKRGKFARVGPSQT